MLFFLLATSVVPLSPGASPMPRNVKTTQLQDLINVVNSSDVLIRLDPTFVTNGQPCTALQVSDQIPYTMIHDCCYHGEKIL